MLQTELQQKIISEFESEIYIDLQGSKIRISRDQPQLVLKKDQKIKLTIEDPTPDSQSIHIGNPNTINTVLNNELQILRLNL